MDKRFGQKNGDNRYISKYTRREVKQSSSHLSYVNFKSPQSLQYGTRYHNRILFKLPESELLKFNSELELVKLSRDRNIYKPDDDFHFIYFPESAVISECQMLEDGKTLEIAMIGKEGLLGISAIFNGNATQNWIQVTIPGTAYRIGARFFQQAFETCEALQKSILDYADFYVKQISQKVVCNSYHLIEKRLCSWLIMIQRRIGDNLIHLTQEQIARFLGVHRPSVTVIMHTLRENHLIDYNRGKITILDLPNLENAACDCYKTMCRMP